MAEIKKISKYLMRKRKETKILLPYVYTKGREKETGGNYLKFF